MGPVCLQSSFLRHILPAILLSAALSSLPLAAGAQQATSNATPDSQADSATTGPDDPITPEDVGDSMLVHRRYQAAIEAYKNASNDSSDVWNKRGIAYQMLSDLKDAERCYKQSLRIRPDHPWALNNLATVYDAQGEIPKAETLYRKALRFEPDSAQALANLGTNLIVQGKYSEGSDLYKRALARDPEVFDESESPIWTNGVPIQQQGATNYYKARDCAQAGMIDRAMKYLRKAVSEGFADTAKIVQDSGFDSLRGNSAFQRLIATHK